MEWLDQINMNQFEVMNHINIVTVLLAVIFAMPILAGIRGRRSLEMVAYSLGRIMSTMELVLGLLAAVLVMRRIPEQFRHTLVQKIGSFMNEEARSFLLRQEQAVYFLMGAVLFWIALSLIRLVTNPVRSTLIRFLSRKLYYNFEAGRDFIKGCIAVLLQIPWALWNTLIVTVLLTLFTSFYPVPLLEEHMDRSGLYQGIYRYSMSPIVNSSFARKLPVLVNDSIGRLGILDIPREAFIPESVDPEAIGEPEGVKGKVRVTRYYNGVTLEEAIRSNAEIDAMARKIADAETNSRKKAKQLYKWVGSNVKYDYDKAAGIGKEPQAFKSGAIPAFETREGICFDYASLYVAMCRAAGIKVRMVTGMANSGVAWGPHAWNQVYLPEEEKWVDVDPTFASGGNYFDNPLFELNHKQAQIVGEW